MSAGERSAAQLSWTASTPVPEPADGERLVLVLESLRALSRVRARVRAFLTTGCEGAPAATCEDVVERAVLVIDELTSNALRHGAKPSSLHISDEVGRWVVVVQDAAPAKLPALAKDRPAGAGGYGLYVITDLTSDHGVQYARDHKRVWACLTKPTPH